MSRKLPAHLAGLDLRETILDAAEKLLATKGFSGFTMEELADEVGIGKGTTYLNFPGKESVALGVVERSVIRVFASLEAIAAQPIPADVRLTELLIARVMLRHRNVAHFDRKHLAELLLVLRQALRERRQKYSGREISIFSRVIQEGIDSGVLKHDEAEAVATAMFWASEGLLPSHVAGDELGEIAIAGRISVVARLLVAGLVVPAPARNSSSRVKRGKQSRLGLRLLGASLIAAMLGFLSPAVAQVSTTQRPFRSPSEARVDSLFARFAFDSTPGCAVGVDSGSKKLIRKAYGMASLELRVHNSPVNVYYGASMAKQFTAAAVLLLEKDGKIRLSDSIDNTYPSCQAPRPMLQSSSFSSTPLEFVIILS